MSMEEYRMCKNDTLPKYLTEPGKERFSIQGFLPTKHFDRQSCEQ